MIKPISQPSSDHHNHKMIDTVTTVTQWCISVEIRSLADLMS